MKFFIVAIAVILVVATASAGPPEDQKMKAEGIIKECAQQVGVAPDVVEKIRAGDWTDREAEAKVDFSNRWSTPIINNWLIFYFFLMLRI